MADEILRKILHWLYPSGHCSNMLLKGLVFPCLTRYPSILCSQFLNELTLEDGESALLSGGYVDLGCAPPKSVSRTSSLSEAGGVPSGRWALWMIFDAFIFSAHRLCHCSK